MGARIRARDWSATPFGDPDGWPESLRSLVSIMLGSSFPTAIYWGPRLLLIYNDAWAPIAGERHPEALGRPGAQVWSDIWDVVGPQFAAVFETGVGFSTFDQMLPMVRSGLVAETYWNYSLTPIRDRDGAVVGVFNQGHETTERVLGERRQAYRLALNERLREIGDPAEAARAVAELLGRRMGASRVGYAEALDDVWIHVERDWTAPGVETLAGRRRLDDFGLAVAAGLRAGRTVRVADALAAPPADGFPAEARAAVAAPLMRDGKLAAFLFIHHDAPRVWSDADLRLIEETAERAGAVRERARAEAALRESESRLRALVLAGSSSVYRMSPDWREMRALDGRGFLADVEAPAVRWLDLYIDPADRPQVLAAIADAVRRKGPFELEHRVRRVDGSFGWTHSHAIPILNEAGEIVEWFGAASDITARRDAEAAVVASDARFRTLFESIDEGIVIIERLPTPPGAPRDWRYVMANAAYSAMFGVDDLSGQTIRDDFRDEDEGWYDIFDAVAATAKPVRFTREAASRNMFLEMFVAPLGPAAEGEPRLLASLRDVTDLQQTQRALEKSEEQLRLATEAAEVGFWDVDEIHQTLAWPPRVKAMFGISADTPVSMKDFYAGLHPEDRERVSAAYAAAADPARRALYDVEYRTVGKEDGLVRWVAAKGRGVFDAAGRCLRMIGTAIDISDRKAEGERLRASEAALGETTATLDAALEHAPIGFAILDRARRFVRVNEALASINGLPAASHVGRAIADVSPRTATAISRQLDRMFETGAPIDSLEIDGAAATGATRSWLASFFPVRGRGGEVQYVGVTGVDITERKRADARVRELNEGLEQRVAEALAEKRRLAEVIERADVLVQVVDAEFNWLAINEASAAAFSRIFGVPRPKAGDNMLAALDGAPEHQAAIRAVWSRALAGEEFVETQAFGPPGEGARSYEMRFRTLRDAQGRAIGAYQFASDVTDRLREQARLAEAESALQQAQKMDAIGQLTGGIAHDFNNLLQGVAGSLDLIRRKPEDPERVRRWAEAGLSAAERGAKLTGQLLAFSRVQKIEAKPLSVPDLLRGMRELLERTLGPAVSVVFDLDPACGLVLADAIQLEMAVLNLAINARDAMPDGGVLTLGAKPRHLDRDNEREAGEFVELSVTDTGSGMPPEVAARAFDPFFTTKGVGKGTGLGLSQVYGMARHAGGVARIATRPGEGTTVSLLLRRTDRPPEGHRDAPDPPAVAASGARILVIDDDEDVRRFMKDALGGAGFALEMAADGRAGLAALDRVRPDVMLLDYAMPGMSGADVFRIARDRWPELPIILTSGYADTSAIERAGGGDISVLRKPFRVEEMLSAIAAVLQGRNGML